MQVAYLINQYPKVSHSFIRREILALEKQGVRVQRIALRGWADVVVDAEDKLEQAKTQYILRHGLAALFYAACRAVVRAPLRFFGAFKQAVALARKADRGLLYHLVYLAEACQLAHWLKAEGASHLHAHFGTNSATVAMLASTLSGLPYSFTVHGPEEFDRPQSLKLGQKIAAAKFVVAISQFGRSQLYRWADFAHWPKIKVVHCGLEPAFFEQANTRMQAGAQLLCVGRICEQKGQLLLVEAAKQLRDSGEQFHLTLAGDGEMRAQVEHLIDQYQLKPHITITGWVSSDVVRDLLLKANLMVLPSFAEGLPVVIMEAMSLKRPVISTYVAGIPELVIPHETGWLCPAGDVAALADTLKKALNTSPATLEKMGERGYQEVLKNHHIDHEAALLAAHFRA